MTKLFELQQRARTFLRDTSGSYVQDDDLTVWANDAQTDLAARLHLFDKTVEAVTVDETIDMPPSDNPALVVIDFLSLAGEEVTFIDETTWNQYEHDGLVAAVTIAYIFNNVIRLYPTPAVGTAYVLRYKYMPDPMEVGADTVTVPMQLERKVVAYMVSMSLMKMGDDGSAFYTIYEQGLPGVELGRDKFFVSPMSMVPERGPFEMDPGSPS